LTAVVEVDVAVAVDVESLVDFPFDHGRDPSTRSGGTRRSTSKIEDGVAVAVATTSL
jgi:hypothetical protein